MRATGGDADHGVVPTRATGPMRTPRLLVPHGSTAHPHPHGLTRRPGIVAAFMAAIATLLALAGCAASAPPSVVVSGATVLIQGPITEATAVAFQRAVGRGEVSRVLLASGGGLVESALAIATEIRNRRLDVEVIGNCFSSCANYLFPAGATKTISGPGVVAWHGNMGHLLHLHASGERPLETTPLAAVQRLAQMENEFFDRIGLDPFICWFGKIEPHRARNLYFLDVDDMARFGLSGVKARPDYARMDVSAHNAQGVVNLQHIKVDWDQLRRPPARP